MLVHLVTIFRGHSKTLRHLSRNLRRFVPTLDSTLGLNITPALKRFTDQVPDSPNLTLCIGTDIHPRGF